MVAPVDCTRDWPPALLSAPGEKQVLAALQWLQSQRSGRIVAAVKSVSDETGRGMAQVALAWLRYRPVPVIPIMGARKLSQFQNNLASFELTLSADQLKTLDDASAIELGFPYDLYAKAMPRAICYGGLRDQILA